MTPTEIIQTVPTQFRPKFDEWLDENYDLYLMFEKEALKVAEMGRRHYSAHRIVEYMRHDSMLRGIELYPDDFKINEAWSSSMARLFAHRNPEYADLFEFRVRRDGVVTEFVPIIDDIL
jgi:hypothetical protein